MSAKITTDGEHTIEERPMTIEDLQEIHSHTAQFVIHLDLDAARAHEQREFSNYGLNDIEISEYYRYDAWLRGGSLGEDFVLYGDASNPDNIIRNPWRR